MKTNSNSKIYFIAFAVVLAIFVGLIIGFHLSGNEEKNNANEKSSAEIVDKCLDLEITDKLFIKSENGNHYETLIQVFLKWKPLSTGLKNFIDFSKNNIMLNNLYSIIFEQDGTFCKISSDDLQKALNNLYPDYFCETENNLFYELIYKLAYTLNMFNFMNNETEISKVNHYYRKNVFNLNEIKDIEKINEYDYHQEFIFDKTTILNFYISITRLLSLMENLSIYNSSKYSFKSNQAYKYFMENFSLGPDDMKSFSIINVADIKSWSELVNEFLNLALTEIDKNDLEDLYPQYTLPVFSNVENIVLHTKNHIILTGFQILDKKYILEAAVIEDLSVSELPSSNNKKQFAFYEFNFDLKETFELKKVQLNTKSFLKEIGPEGSKTLFYKRIN